VISTVDAWLLERLAGTYVTDAATASRTMLLDLESTTWSDEACSLFELDPGSLREIVDCDAAIGETDAFGGTLPVTCRIHMSFWDKDGSQSTFPGDDPHEPSDVFRQVLAGLTGSMRELTVFLAPNINSYKRFAAESWAPTTLAYGRDNRTCGFRLVGHGSGLRVESRIPGADANPYLAFAAMIAVGLHGIDNELEAPPMFQGNAYEDATLARVPSTLREAIAELESSKMAREAFGDEVVDHYLNYARTEQRLFDEVVTCYERERLFERV
jgi:glutamine synthetase